MLRRHPARAVEAGAGRDADPPRVPPVLPRVDPRGGRRPARPRGRVRVRGHGRGVPGTAGRRAGPVHVRRGRGGRADEQRGRAGAPPRRLLAEDQLRDRLGGREPVRRAGADRGGLLPAAGPGRAGVPDRRCCQCRGRDGTSAPSLLLPTAGLPLAATAGYEAYHGRSGCSWLPRTTIRARYELLKPHLEGRLRRLWAAAEAAAIGRGGPKLVSAATGISCAPHLGRAAGAATAALPAGVPRPAGSAWVGSRIEDREPTLVGDLEQMLADEIAGDPMTSRCGSGAAAETPATSSGPRGTRSGIHGRTACSGSWASR